VQRSGVGGHAGIQVVHIERGTAAVGRFLDHVPQQVQCVGKAGGEGILEREWRRLSLPGLGEGGDAANRDGVRLR
jgi:hypothetical protein